MTEKEIVLGPGQIERYSRQILVHEIGAAGQSRLLRARVRLSGAPVALGIVAGFLAGAGVGRIDPGDAETRISDPRNPDSQLAPVPDPDLEVFLVGPVRPRHAGAAVVAGAATSEGVVVAEAPDGRFCEACFDAVVPQSAPSDALTATWLGSIVSTAALRRLLGLAPDTPGVTIFGRTPPFTRSSALGPAIHRREPRCNSTPPPS